MYEDRGLAHLTDDETEEGTENPKTWEVVNSRTRIRTHMVSSKGGFSEV